MSNGKKISRRRFLTEGAGVAAGAALSACGTPTAAPVETAPTKGSVPTSVPEATSASAEATATTAPAATAAPVAQFKESPMLAELVKAGKLPPVEERLPPSPVVVDPTNAVGKYGGTLYATGMAPETTNDAQIGAVAGFFHFSDDLQTVTPEVAESFELLDDNKVCIIHLRQGLKWSDGEPFTADDVIFFFEDFQFNTDLYPTLGTNWQPGRVPMTFSKVDDFTVKFEFAVPNPAFALLHYSGAPIEAFRPKHYVQKYHIKYNAKADDEAKAAGFDNWQARFKSMVRETHNYGAQDPEMPVLGPWRGVKFDRQRQY